MGIYLIILSVIGFTIFNVFQPPQPQDCTSLCNKKCAEQRKQIEEQTRIKINSKVLELKQEYYKKIREEYDAQEKRNEEEKESIKIKFMNNIEELRLAEAEIAALKTELFKKTQ